MDLTALITAVRIRCGVTATDQQAGDAALTQLINAAITKIENAHPNGWPWYRSEYDLATVASTESYLRTAIDSSVVITKIRSARMLLGDGGWYPTLQRLSRTEQLEQYPSETPARPESWSLGYTSGVLTVHLRPVPEAVYTIKFDTVIAETPLTAGAHLPLIPARFHDAIVEHAAAGLFRRLHNVADANVAAAEALAWHARMMQSASRDYGGPGRSRSRMDEAI